VFSAIAAAAGAVVSIITILDHNFSATREAAQQVNMRLIGTSLLSTEYDGFILPFEVISILLIAAMVGAIVIAKKGGPRKAEVQTSNKQ